MKKSVFSQVAKNKTYFIGKILIIIENNPKYTRKIC